ncbi:ABC transporter permease [Bacillus cereus]|uniref:ABC transporter permease n=1 Tax=Bacillus cereus TaxID=1396 RepID=UPI00384E4E1B
MEFNIKRYFILYTKYFSKHLKVMMEYKMDFFIGMVSVLFQQLASIFFLKIVFNHIEVLNGWNFYQILFIYGISFLGRSLHHIFFDNLWTVGWQYIRTGNLDRIMIRPVNPLFQIISERVQQDGIGQFIIGIIIISTSVNHLELSLGVIDVIMLCVLILSSGVIFIAINLFFITFSFWMVDSLPIVSAVFQFSEFPRYPLNIYPKFIVFFITWIIPYGFTAFYPAAYFFEDSNYKIISLCTPLVALIVAFISYKFWKKGLANFTSVGH